ncbi:class I SAM-dependent methyltransferase [Dokdonia sinensis]|uniref:Class I SAM-dependent methyltransferase n=1 Tax=Dokdonia sinensis TaxID=2479847 RepID=A0A3M0FU79_9FLAO|nr:class I SAM-dependent methyltransferase [Dokdonia sinensis]RMB56068.1 class I SAM-dependent methyltransferase [Dokdonia sinensis]
MLYQAKHFLKFRRKAKNEHGIHSPFVYDLVTKCFYDKEPKPYYKRLKQYRKALLGDKRTITVTDFGAGSRVFKGSERKIAAIAKHAGARKKRMKLLARLVHYFEMQSILEIGTSVGMGTVALAARSGSQVTSLEGCPETAQVAREMLKRMGVINVDVVVGRFYDTLESYSEKSEKKLLPSTLDLIYFDGNHAKEATLSYVNLLLPTVHNDTVWILDDIHWSPEMTAAWKAIKAMEMVTVTIDCFWLGFVFFRKEQAREDFLIRL